MRLDERLAGRCRLLTVLAERGAVRAGGRPAVAIGIGLLERVEVGTVLVEVLEVLPVAVRDKAGGGVVDRVDGLKVGQVLSDVADELELAFDTVERAADCIAVEVDVRRRRLATFDGERERLVAVARGLQVGDPSAKERRRKGPERLEVDRDPVILVRESDRVLLDVGPPVVEALGRRPAVPALVLCNGLGQRLRLASNLGLPFVLGFVDELCAAARNAVSRLA